ncbi:hypothetical protein RUND412_002027 [Rhizina undulata]
MSEHDPFPNVKEKLQAPTKKSAFEKSRLEAEARRLREEAETAAVYKEFVASFNDDSSSPGSNFSSGRGGFGGGRGGANFRGAPPTGPGRRHFTGPPARGGLGLSAPPPRKRNLEAAFERERGDEAGVFGGLGGEKRRREREKEREREGGLLAFENSGLKGKEKYDEDDSDSDNASKPHPKPTLHLTSLPPGTTKTTLTNLLSTTPLKIDSIRIIPAPPPPGPSQPSPSIRKAASALITLSPETPSSDIDSTVFSLNGRYLGSGFWLGITRHLPSTIIGSAPATLGPTTTSNPFGAKAPIAAPGSLSRAPPPHRGGFAPPGSYRSAPPATGLQVHVQPPSDLKQLKLIHKMLESILTYGPEFEALLMANEAVKNDVKFSWLWDARSQAGVYYRWKLWDIVTGSAVASHGRQPPAVEIFEPAGAGGAVWIPPKKTLKYEWAGSLKDVVDDEGFRSDELDEGDESDEEDDRDRPVGLAGGEGRKGRGFLGVLERAKLVHLISRLPTVTSKVRRGDVGRIMAFAMEHAEGGMGEEVVQVLVNNVLKPLSFTHAAKPESASDDEPNSPKAEESEPDTSSAKIIALWVISDILSNSSLGVRNAWRYRQLFDAALREKQVFRHLGEVYKGSGWGRMKAEKFRRGVVEGVLEGWEKWCIFPQSTQEEFLNSFLNPSPTQSLAPPATHKEDENSRSNTPIPATKSKWKTVEATPSAFNPVQSSTTEDVDGAPAEDEDVDGAPMEEDVDGAPMEEDVDGEPMVDEDLDGEPMVEDEEKQEKEEEKDEREKEPEKKGLGMGMMGFSMSGMKGGMGKRKRMRAEDMFKDDEED